VVLVFCVLAAAAVFLLVEGLGSSLNYYETVHQALSRRSALGTTVFRLEGTVAPGSIHPTADGTDFVVSQGTEEVAVHSVGSPPQLFHKDIPVIVVGHFASTSSDVFMSNQIMEKHSQTYSPLHTATATASSAHPKSGTAR
jgi:cytochrome c-type biogenesis protein CcmE